MRSLQTPSAQLGPWPSRHSRASIAALFLLAVSSLSADQFVWTTKTPNSLVRCEAVGGAAGSKLYQFSGYCTLRPKILATTQCDAYDPATDTWTSLASIVNSRCRHHPRGDRRLPQLGSGQGANIPLIKHCLLRL